MEFVQKFMILFCNVFTKFSERTHLLLFTSMLNCARTKKQNKRKELITNGAFAICRNYQRQMSELSQVTWILERRMGCYAAAARNFP